MDFAVMFTVNCYTFSIRDMTQKLKAKHMTEKEGTNARAEFLPVEWRSSLKLDGDTVESITPTKIRGLRSALNASAMDILYYTSPLYRSEVRQIFIKTKISVKSSFQEKLYNIK